MVLLLYIPCGQTDGKDLYANICFNKRILVSVNLAADLYPPGPKSWSTHSWQIKAATKDFHDRLLRYLFSDSATRGTFHVKQLSEDQKLLQNQLNWTFPWNRMSSAHNRQDQITAITISDGGRSAEALRFSTRDCPDP
jgi:hypothetical protein